MTIPLTITARDLIVGDRIIRFTHDADAGITRIEAMASGGIMLSLVIIDHADQDIAGRTYFIARPDAVYTVQRKPNK